MIARFPKVVASFRYGGSAVILRRQMDAAAAAILSRAALHVTGRATATLAMDLVERNGLWEAYPKILCDREFPQDEETGLRQYVADVSAILLADLTAVGATSITIEAERRG